MERAVSSLDNDAAVLLLAVAVAVHAVLAVAGELLLGGAAAGSFPFPIVLLSRDPDVGTGVS